MDCEDHDVEEIDCHDEDLVRRPGPVEAVASLPAYLNSFIIILLLVDPFLGLTSVLDLLDEELVLVIAVLGVGIPLSLDVALGILSFLVRCLVPEPDRSQLLSCALIHL